MSDIVLSRGIRSNLLSLQRTADLIGTTQGRLATGKRVNSALDNPSNFFTAQGLNSRANDLSNLLDSMSNSVKTIEAADNGLKGITKLIESAQATARQARQDPGQSGVATLTGTNGVGGDEVLANAANRAGNLNDARAKQLIGPRGAGPTGGIGLDAGDTITLRSGSASATFTVGVGMTVGDLVDRINNSGLATAAIDSTGRFTIQSNNGANGVSLSAANADGSAEDLSALFGRNDAGQPSFFGQANGSQTVTGGAIGLAAGGDLTAGALTTDFAAGDTITLTQGSEARTFTITAGQTYQQLVDQINATGVFRANIGVGNALSIQGLNSGAITVTSSNAAALGDLDGAGFTATTTAIASTASSARQNLAATFNEIRQQIDRLAQDAGFNGVNLLNGDSMDVVFNERTGQNRSSMTVRGQVVSSANLGVQDAATAYGNFASNAQVDTALSDLTNALSNIRTQSSSLGSQLSTVQTRQDFTRATMGTLRAGADNLTLADQNEEAANLLALQTRQQLANTALSLANQADQGVLRLFS